jgi:hypothetical protein
MAGQQKKGRSARRRCATRWRCALVPNFFSPKKDEVPINLDDALFIIKSLHGDIVFFFVVMVIACSGGRFVLSSKIDF